MLILFDIDGTLIRTAGAGLESLCAAGRDLHGPDFAAHGTDPAGRVDPDIVADLLRVNGVAPTRDAIKTMREHYLGHLDRALGDGRPLTVLPGVHELIAALGERDGVTQGLLSGNFRESGQMKLRHCGIDLAPFRVDAFGCDCDWDAPERRQLPPIAVDRLREETGRAVEGADVVVVGDTPNDVDCARHHGYRALAVATGWCDTAELAATGAEIVVDDLANTAAILNAILG